MRNKISFKLTLYFFTALLIFSIVIGSFFLALFRDQIVSAKKTQMLTQGEVITTALSESTKNIRSVSQGRGQAMQNRRENFNSYLRILRDFSKDPAWIVDENLELITGVSDGRQYRYADLPAGAEEVVKAVFEGETSFSQGFNTLLDTPSLTLGLPINLNGRVIGALLLHAPVKGISETTSQGIRIFLISTLAALLLSVLFTVPLALSMAKPLKKMKNTATSLTQGDYAVRTEVLRQDEIGELACAIDILSDRLRESQRESEKLEKLRRDFVANISHELRTPVTVIRGSLEALIDKVISQPEQINDYHSQMLSECIYLEGLVNDLLELSKLQNPDFRIELEEINLCDVITDAVRSAGQMAQKKDVHINLDMDKSLCLIRGDYARLRQMLMVVLDNAIKFSPKGGQIELRLKDKTITISDEGPGISPELLPHIFDRFYKVQTEGNKQGSGLGLAIAKEIGDRHDILITAGNRSERGAEFRFALK